MREGLLSVFLTSLVHYLTWYFFIKTLEALSEAMAKLILMSMLIMLIFSK